MGKFLIKIFILVAATVVTSCVPKLKVHKVFFDESAGFYKYERKGNRIALRKENGELLFRDDLKGFLNELSYKNMRYNFDMRSEISLLFIPQEHSMLSLYNGIQDAIEEKNAMSGLFLADEFEKLYPFALKYTDIDFFRGQLWELLNKDSAGFYYKRFINFSEKKYSGYFRGYENDTTGINCFIKERQYALNYQKAGQVSELMNCKKELTRKYYYQSFSQGFVLNREDFGPLKRNLFGVGFEYSKDNDLIVGVSNVWLTSEKYIFRSGISYTKNQFDLVLTGSYQLYKSANNNIGLKVSPMIMITQLTARDTMQANSSYVNPGITLSFGCHLNQRWYFGASYTAFLVNQYDYKSFKQNHYQENSYDISVYYQLIKGISFKAGIDSGYPVLGLSLNGSSLGYFFGEKSFGVRMSYY